MLQGHTGLVNSLAVLLDCKLASGSVGHHHTRVVKRSKANTLSRRNLSIVGGGESTCGSDIFAGDFTLVFTWSRRPACGSFCQNYKKHVPDFYFIESKNRGSLSLPCSDTLDICIGLNINNLRARWRCANPPQNSQKSGTRD